MSPQQEIRCNAVLPTRGEPGEGGSPSAVLAGMVYVHVTYAHSHSCPDGGYAAASAVALKAAAASVDLWV